MLQECQALEVLAEQWPEVALGSEDGLHEMNGLAQSLRHRLIAEGRFEDVLKRGQRDTGLHANELEYLRRLLELIEV